MRADETVRVPLEAKRSYRLKIEWRRGDANGPFDLKWMPPRPARPDDPLVRVGRGHRLHLHPGREPRRGDRGLSRGHGPGAAPAEVGLRLLAEPRALQLADRAARRGARVSQAALPLDVIVQDWRYWRDGEWGSHVFDPTRFPDPAGHDRRGAPLERAHPHLGMAEVLSGHRQLRRAEEGRFPLSPHPDAGTKDWLGYVFTFYDAFNPKGRKVFWRQIKDAIFSKGFDGWWLDANEPNLVDDPSPEEQARLIEPTALGPAARVMNAYPLVHSEGVYKSQREAAPDRRVAILARSAWAGSQRTGSIAWSGDTTGALGGASGPDPGRPLLLAVGPSLLEPRHRRLQRRLPGREQERGIPGAVRPLVPVRRLHPDLPGPRPDARIASPGSTAATIIPPSGRSRSSPSCATGSCPTSTRWPRE